ncbi:MAG: class I SAM-dependent methyltransferase [Nitrospinaceae bacterium]|nr:class I SAM-dependent methyltransferase [Nitrospinaceae bacterium]
MNCPLCHNPSPELHLQADLREYWLCPKCALVFVPSEFFISEEEAVKRYLEHENSLDNEGYVKMFQEKIDTVKRICSEVKTVLDYGCGYEPVLKTLLDREGYQAHGYDLNFFPNEEPHREYDLIISTETFEHFKEPRNELNHLIRKISNEGYLAVMTRFYPVNNRALCPETFSKWYYKRDPTHVAFYCPETFSWIADEFKMKVRHNNENDFIIMQKK